MASGRRSPLLAYDEAVADKWGQLQARVQRRGRPRPQNDTWIAACRPVDDLPLATLNIKDFTDYAEHEGLTLISSQSPDRYARLPPVSTGHGSTLEILDSAEWQPGPASRRCVARLSRPGSR